MIVIETVTPIGIVILEKTDIQLKIEDQIVTGTGRILQRTVTVILAEIATEMLARTVTVIMEEIVKWLETEIATGIILEIGIKLKKLAGEIVTVTDVPRQAIVIGEGKLMTMNTMPVAVQRKEETMTGIEMIVMIEDRRTETVFRSEIEGQIEIETVEANGTMIVIATTKEIEVLMTGETETQETETQETETASAEIVISISVTATLVLINAIGIDLTATLMMIDRGTDVMMVRWTDIVTMMTIVTRGAIGGTQMTSLQMALLQSLVSLPVTLPSTQAGTGVIFQLLLLHRQQQ